MVSKEMSYEEYVYLSLSGLLTEPHPEVQNLFAEGEKCAVLYDRVYNDCQKLCERLGTFEDKDVEDVINSMLEIQREIALKMYEYGATFRNKASFFILQE